MNISEEKTKYGSCRSETIMHESGSKPHGFMPQQTSDTSLMANFTDLPTELVIFILQ